MSRFNLKHAIHVMTFLSFIALAEYWTFTNLRNDSKTKQHSLAVIIFLYFTQHLVLLSLPLLIFNFLGLTLFNAFDNKIEVDDDKRDQLLEIPHLCFRVVTRGLYAELVQSNVNKNFQTCTEAGLNNFSMEVVTDKEIPLIVKEAKIRQLVVPETYQTSTGALFKARALQYALEPQVSLLNQGDYIVHLDEETLLTKNVINGIINFVLDGKHDFGQGLITYTNQEIVNYFTTLADFFRVAEDMGKIRSQFYLFHKPLFGWKGSFIVSKYESERDVSFDHGPDGSIAEDFYFSLIAFSKGYSFNFIRGEMWEKSPFSIYDLIRQRRRWLQGLWLVVHSRKIPVPYKILVTMSLYAWVTIPLVGISFIVMVMFPMPTPIWINYTATFCFAVSIYMYIFGVLKAHDLKESDRSLVFAYLLGVIITIPLNMVVEDIAAVWGLIGSKHNFYIVEKDVKPKVVLEA